MNNKGQSLILFVLIIPIVLLIFLMVYDIGRLSLLKNELNNINYLTIDYGLDNIDNINIKSKMHEMIAKNKTEIDKIDINIEDDKIYITLSDKIDTKVSIISLFDITSSYVGYIEDGEKIIEKNR